MATNYPTSLDSLTNPVSSDTLASPDHAAQHQNVNDAVEALQSTVGITNSADTNSLQYRLTLKTDKAVTFVTYTSSQTLALSDASLFVQMNSASGHNLTVPPNSSVAFPVGTVINVLQIGAGQTTIVAGSGVTVNYAIGLKLRAQWSSAMLVKRATDTWVAIGDLSA